MLRSLGSVAKYTGKQICDLQLFLFWPLDSGRLLPHVKNVLRLGVLIHFVLTILCIFGKHWDLALPLHFLFDEHLDLASELGSVIALIFIFDKLVNPGLPLQCISLFTEWRIRLSQRLVLFLFEEHLDTVLRRFFNEWYWFTFLQLLVLFLVRLHWLKASSVSNGKPIFRVILLFFFSSENLGSFSEDNMVLKTSSRIVPRILILNCFCLVVLILSKYDLCYFGKYGFFIFWFSNSKCSHYLAVF